MKNEIKPSFTIQPSSKANGILEFTVLLNLPQLLPLWFKREKLLDNIHYYNFQIRCPWKLLTIGWLIWGLAIPSQI